MGVPSVKKVGSDPSEKQRVEVCQDAIKGDPPRENHWKQPEVERKIGTSCDK